MSSASLDYRFHRREAHRMLGNVLADPDPDEAVRHLLEAARADGERAEAALDLVRLRLRRGEYAEARRWIAFAAEMKPPREPTPWGGTKLPYLIEAPAWNVTFWHWMWRRAT